MLIPYTNDSGRTTSCVMPGRGGLCGKIINDGAKHANRVATWYCPHIKGFLHVRRFVRPTKSLA